MRLFDSNACFGMETVNHEVINHEGFIVIEKVDLAKTAAELLAYMDHAGIERAVVWRREMFDFDPSRGNDLLTCGIREAQDRLIPSWVILPAITDREFEPDLLFKRMKESGVRLLRAWPLQNRYILSSVTMARQLDMIAQLKIPLFLEPRPGYEYIYALLSEFSDLTVVLCNIGCWPSGRYVFPLLDKYPNVYFETGDFGMWRGYETVCEQFGSERMLFGTGFPTNNMGGAVNCLLHANISEADKRNVAYENMDRLLNAVRI